MVYISTNFKEVFVRSTKQFNDKLLWFLRLFSSSFFLVSQIQIYMNILKLIRYFSLCSVYKSFWLKNIPNFFRGNFNCKTTYKVYLRRLYMFVSRSRVINLYNYCYFSLNPEKVFLIILNTRGIDWNWHVINGGHCHMTNFTCVRFSLLNQEPDKSKTSWYYLMLCYKK